MNDSNINKINSLTRKWWFYLLLLIPIFIRACASKGFNAHQSMDVILNALANPLIFRIPILFPIVKMIPIILIVGVIVYGNRIRHFFNGYSAILFFLIAVFQNIAQTEKYGLVIVIGNLIMGLIVAFVWTWETFAAQNDFSPRKIPLWKWWVIPFALLALLSPIDSRTLAPDYSLERLITSESGLTICMMIPVMLGVLTLYYPTVNLPLLRIVSFVGIYFGIVNMIAWFLLFPFGWWMGVLHIPLLFISIYAFILGFWKKNNNVTQRGGG